MFDKELVGQIYQEAGALIPERIGMLSHMFGVSNIAGYLAHELNRQRNLGIDQNLLETAAMVHDIGKMFDETLWGHVEEGIKFLQKIGIDERIIHLVEIHQLWKNEVTRLLTWEEKLIILGDLSFKGEIMSVRERVEDIIDRYTGHGIPQGQEKWIRKLSQDIYQEISIILPNLPI